MQRSEPLFGRDSTGACAKIMFSAHHMIAKLANRNDYTKRPLAETVEQEYAELRKKRGSHMIRILFVFAMLAVMSCASEQGFREMADTWIGATESEVVSQLGPPSNVYVTPSGDRVLTYSEEGSMTLPGTAPSYQSTVYGSTVYSTPIGGSPPSTISLSCELSFVFKNDRVINWSSRGNNCVS